MNKRFHVQRLHVVHSLDSLLYQLHTLSFFLSPSLWLYICRVISQFHCSKPRELDPTRSLRFFLTALIFLNLPNFWNHAMRGAVEGRTIILDFVGMSFVPSKIQLLSLDMFIMVLQLLLITIAYETSAYYHSEEADQQDVLLAEPPTRPFTIPLFYTSLEPSSEASQSSAISHKGPKVLPPSHGLPFVIDLHFNPLIAQLRHPPLPPLPQSRNSDSVLPLPSTTSWHLPGIRMWMRATQMRESREGGSRTLPMTAADSETQSNLPGEIDLRRG
ncbi:hypothetical protein CPB84DRAFT_1959917 [Gymnopilus junonius]|uniref:DUF1746 domain-containing protein n=1 Tax=Gymnopilus junonius TaxID=109634 RepID=A0A9P5NU38_GYMJU|nr:hypothetical protein CPB84DRAFT_1959917 [Gymnopilus junonius]